MKTLYRICWEINGVERHGNACLDFETALAWISDQKERNPDIMHWIEPVEVEEPGIDY